MRNQTPSVPMGGHHYIRDLNDTFLYCNDAMAKWHGFESSSDVHGLIPAQLPLIKKLSNKFVSFDKRIASSEQHCDMLTYLQSSSGDWVLTYDKKQPYYDEQHNIIGVEGLSLFVSPVFATTLIEKLELLRGGRSPESFMIFNQSPAGLSDRQSECFYFYLKGRSAREISKLLKISVRTVEKHIENIKIKLKCSTRSELTEYAIDQGFMQVVPVSLLG